MKFLLKCFSLGGWLAAFWLPATLFSSGHFSASCSSCSPGSTLVVRFKGDFGDVPERVKGLRQHPRFYAPDETGGAYWALLAVPLDAKPGNYTLAGTWIEPECAGEKEESFTIAIKPADFPHASLTVASLKQPMLGSLKKEALIQRRALGIGGKAHGRALGPLWEGLFTLPLKVFKRISSGFGYYRIYNHGAAFWQHRGVDITAPEGSVVLAANDGRVRLARKLKAHGGSIILEHGDGLDTCYFHLSKLLVRRNQSVKKGQVIGLVGSTGIATGPHLHWQMMLNGFAVNPLEWIPGWQQELLKNKTEAYVLPFKS